MEMILTEMVVGLWQRDIRVDDGKVIPIGEQRCGVHHEELSTSGV